MRILQETRKWLVDLKPIYERCQQQILEEKEAQNEEKETEAKNVLYDLESEIDMLFDLQHLLEFYQHYPAGHIEEYRQDFMISSYHIQVMEDGRAVGF